MVSKSIIGATCACLAAVSISANAALVPRLGGLAYYDDVAGLTWLADANAAGTAMNWADANTWAAGLDINGVTGWRLANTLQPDASCSVQNGSVSQGFNCTGSEMGNLFYNVLGGIAGSGLSATNANYNLFSNIQSVGYWSATEYAPSTDGAWDFVMGNGDQEFVTKGNFTFAWAVQSGDVGTVPVPATVWLFASGFVGLIGVARRKARV